MKHKHYDMIVAKAANMELVVFIKMQESWELFTKTATKLISFSEDYDYFLCLPQHKETCLHWLNGGRIEYRNELAPSGWGGVSSIKETLEEDMEEGESLWSGEVYFMRTDTPIRIKPKGEKRLIVVNGDHVELASTERIYPEGAQFIEIEVEV